MRIIPVRLKNTSKTGEEIISCSQCPCPVHSDSIDWCRHIETVPGYYKSLLISNGRLATIALISSIINFGVLVLVLLSLAK